MPDPGVGCPARFLCDLLSPPTTAETARLADRHVVVDRFALTRVLFPDRAVHA